MTGGLSTEVLNQWLWSLEDFSERYSPKYAYKSCILYAGNLNFL